MFYGEMAQLCTLYSLLVLSEFQAQTFEFLEFTSVMSQGTQRELNAEAFIAS